MAWVAFDRAIKAVERYGPRARWIAGGSCAPKCTTRSADTVSTPERNTFTQYYGSDELDASLLMIPLVGFLPAERSAGHRNRAGDRARSDVERFRSRYDTKEHIDGLPAWRRRRSSRARSGWPTTTSCRDDTTRRVGSSSGLLGLCNDLGLMSEEYDPDARRQLGNFPQAFSHVMLINTARNLSRPHGPAEERRA